jgi:hypothetical protein
MNKSEYYGYTIRENAATGRWEIFWGERKQEVDFAASMKPRNGSTSRSR